MKVEIDKLGNVSKLKQVYNGVEFTSDDGERLSVVMRDSGFELTYEGQRIDLKRGRVIKFDSKLRGVARPTNTEEVKSGVQG